MKKPSSRIRRILIALAVLLAAGAGTGVAAATSINSASGWPYWPVEPNSQVTVSDISGNTPQFSSVFPQVAVSPTNPNVVAVAWRQYNLPINTNALADQRTADCHIAVSTNGGATFQDTDLTPLFRAYPAASAIALYFCNAPWVAFGRDGTLYAGGSVFTAGGTAVSTPKQGRAMFAISHNNGGTWSVGGWGIDLSRFAPGLTGLSGGTLPQDTPWDGSNGFTDPQTGTFYSTSGGYVVASDNQGQTFGTVYEPNPPGWGSPSYGTMTSAFGVLAAPFIAASAPVAGATCPCLGLATSTDEGASWTGHLVAQASDFSTTGTVRYPVATADPRIPGHFAIAAYTPDHLSPKVYYTADGGQTWNSATPGSPDTNGQMVSANQVGVGYTTSGQILLVWRGFYREAGAFDTFAAMLHGSQFGQVVTVSPEPSVYPPLIYLGNYDASTGGGDFTTWITGNSQYAFVAFPYSPDALAEDTFFAKIPLSSMR